MWIGIVRVDCNSQEYPWIYLEKIYYTPREDLMYTMRRSNIYLEKILCILGEELIYTWRKSYIYLKKILCIFGEELMYT